MTDLAYVATPFTYTLEQISAVQLKLRDPTHMWHSLLTATPLGAEMYRRMAQAACDMDRGAGNLTTLDGLVKESASVTSHDCVVKCRGILQTLDAMLETVTPQFKETHAAKIQSVRNVIDKYRDSALTGEMDVFSSTLHKVCEVAPLPPPSVKTSAEGISALLVEYRWF